MDGRVDRPTDLYRWIDAELDRSERPVPQDVARDAWASLPASRREHLGRLMVEALFLDRAYERQDEVLTAVLGEEREVE